MPAVDKMVRSHVRKMARQGRLIDECFKTFQRLCYPDAPPDQVATMRVCFFAGAAELNAVLLAGLDDGSGETAGDMAFMSQWQEELERFHERTIKAMTAGSSGKSH
jgi:hypothetical protein